jgi:hypothetical protein
MLTKSLTKRIDTTEVRFYLADDFREEKDGKVSAINLFTEPRVVMQAPAILPDPSQDSPAALQALSFLFNVSKAPVGASVSIDLKGPTGTQSVLKDQPLPDPSAAGESINLIMRRAPFIVTALGTRTFTVTVNKREFKFDFSIDRQDSQIRAVATNSPPAKSAPKRRSKKVPT